MKKQQKQALALIKSQKSLATCMLTPLIFLRQVKSASNRGGVFFSVISPGVRSCSAAWLRARFSHRLQTSVHRQRRKSISRRRPDYIRFLLLSYCLVMTSPLFYIRKAESFIFAVRDFQHFFVIVAAASAYELST